MPPLPHYVPFGRPNFSEEEIEAVTRVMRSGWIGMGPETIRFEEEFSEAVKAPHVVTVNSATSALFLSLLVHGVGPGDEVICPSLTWCSTANAVLYLGAQPVFCEVDSNTLCATAETVRAALSKRTRAVIIVHFGGFAADVDSIRAVLPPKIALIEDAAHAFGATYPNGRPVGGSGHFSCFSFYANKNLVAGEGGAVSLFDPQLADRLRSLRQHALPLDAWKRFTHPKSVMLSNQLTELGYKMNFTDLQAAIARVQLKRQPEFAKTRLAVATVYYKQLSRLRPKPLFQSHCTADSHARHLFTLQLPFEKMKVSREELLLSLRARNVGATIHYAPLHSMPLYDRRKTDPKLTTTERIARNIITLPISASMTVVEAEEIVKQVKEITET